MPIEPALPTVAGQNEGLDFVNVLRDCLSCGVITFNERRAVTSLNSKAELITGLSESNAISGGIALFPAPLRKIIEECFSTGKPANDRHITLGDAKRGEIAIQVTATASRNETGAPTGVVAVLNDISAVKKWEANLRRLDRLHSIGTLSASMAHEVRNAFVPIRTFVDLLLEKNQEADLADIVRVEMNRLDSIIGQMLKFSGPAKPNFAPVHVHSILDKSLVLIQRLLGDKTIQLTRAFNAIPDLIDGDKDQLEQAFLNLFFNAIDAMDAGGRLVVSTELLPSDSVIEALATLKGRQVLRINIRDSGIGIPPDNLDRLYEPFFTTKPDGTGLGLAITRRITQEHQGVISVESEVNKGATFSLLFPARISSL